jgi:arylsulfotransferase ASST
MVLRRNFLASFLSLLGVASLSFLLGAAVIFFDVPPSSFLRRAFIGGITWHEHKAASTSVEEQSPALTVGQIASAGKTSEGFTLCMYGKGSLAVLIDMRGEMVHQWHVPFSELWTDPPHLRGRIEDAKVYFSGGRVYPNGDLLAVIEGPITLRNPSNGHGLVKLDRYSRVLWKYAEKCHHDVDVAEDGTIYALVNEMVEQVPPQLAYLPTPCMIDFVDVISPEGKRRKRISLLEALVDTPYAALFGILERPETSGGAAPRDAQWVPPSLDDARRRDVLHTNTIKILSRTLASKFPLFKEGQLLVSLRNLNALAVLDPDSGKVVWAARSLWHSQHDPSFLENGHLLLFDNLGWPKGSRVLEYDPRTQAFPWIYPGDRGTPFYSEIRGMTQRLSNGNTLIVNSEAGTVFEVTPGQEMVWTCSCGNAKLYCARRYTPEQLPFLKGEAPARP